MPAPVLPSDLYIYGPPYIALNKGYSQILKARCGKWRSGPRFWSSRLQCYEPPMQPVLPEASHRINIASASGHRILGQRHWSDAAGSIKPNKIFQPGCLDWCQVSETDNLFIKSRRSDEIFFGYPTVNYRFYMKIPDYKSIGEVSQQDIDFRSSGRIPIFA